MTNTIDTFDLNEVISNSVSLDDLEKKTIGFNLNSFVNSKSIENKGLTSDVLDAQVDMQLGEFMKKLTDKNTVSKRLKIK